MKRFVWIIMILFVVSCTPQTLQAPTQIPSPTISPTLRSLSTITVPPALTPTSEPNASPTPKPLVPHFDHIVVIILENREYDLVIDNAQAPNINRYAKQYTLLTQHYAIMHPSLPNYIALVGGDTFGIKNNCTDCFIDAPNLADQIESAGLTWKTYQEHMPQPCFVGDTLRYFQKHNPFIYFDDIRLDSERCQRSVVPLTQLDADLASGDLPNLIWIEPDICNSAHDCDLSTGDAWESAMVERFLAIPGFIDNSLIILTFEEGQGDHTCCGLTTGGGRVATVLISGQVKSGFQDAIQYTHYSVLRTIETAWGLPLLGHAADAETNLIKAPWK
jgi:phospholipase C